MVYDRRQTFDNELREMPNSLLLEQCTVVATKFVPSPIAKTMSFKNFALVGLSLKISPPTHSVFRAVKCIISALRRIINKVQL